MLKNSNRACHWLTTSVIIKTVVFLIKDKFQEIMILTVIPLKPVATALLLPLEPATTLTIS